MNRTYAYFRAAGSLLASKPTRSGASIVINSDQYSNCIDDSSIHIVILIKKKDSPREIF